ncbi:hypothetical protein BDF21DRAFT_400214 [Thamnidium elegans]|nr:hypothetical protein BDF21DRAFT_400214 [Thamnidium elegans]
MSSNLYYIFFRCFFLLLYTLHGGDCSSRILVAPGAEKKIPFSTWRLSKMCQGRRLRNVAPEVTQLLPNPALKGRFKTGTNLNDPLTLPYCPSSHLNHVQLPPVILSRRSLSFYAGGDALSKQAFYARDTVAAGNNTSFYPLMILRCVSIATMRDCKGPLRLGITSSSILIPELVFIC